MCGPCAEPGEGPPEPERFIGYAKCYQCGELGIKVTQHFGYIHTKKCEKCGGK
jgi:translation initiation factor 2 beta subunit (eIF-2beta)/eIF-5